MIGTKKLKIIIYLCSVLLLFGSLAYVIKDYLNFCFRPLDLSGGELIFEIKPGSGFKQVINKLHQQKIIKYPELILSLGEFFGWSKRLKAGYYKFAAPITSLGVLKQIILGQTMQGSFRIGEGWSVAKIMQNLADYPYIKHDLNKNISANELADQLNLPVSSAEGLFFPDTYKFTAGISDQELLKHSYQQLEKKLAEIWKTRAAAVESFSPYQALILASLLEKETAIKDEKPKIAGVLLRRLNSHMKLQVDPTVIYALGDAYQGKLNHQDLSVNSPYNTYLNYGLPPSPIGTFSEDSLRAVLHPEDGDELYYVAMQNGRHYFTNNLADHKNAINKYLKNPSINTAPQVFKSLDFIQLPIFNADFKFKFK